MGINCPLTSKASGSQPSAAICFPFYWCEGITCYFTSRVWKQNYCCYATQQLWRKRSCRHFDGPWKSVNDATVAVTALYLLCAKEHSSYNLKKLWNFSKETRVLRNISRGGSRSWLLLEDTILNWVMKLVCNSGHGEMAEFTSLISGSSFCIQILAFFFLLR